MAAILSPLGLYGGNRKTKLPLRPNFRIRTTECTLGIFVFAPSDRCPATANLLSLDASLAIPTRVLCFEVSGLRCRTPVGLVLLTGQTGTHSQTGQTGLMLLHLRLRSSVLALWINQGT
jgi:hypothetical protein